jgi:hypothetical protein
MPKRKTARLAVLELSDLIMQITVPAHETQCDEEKCSLDVPCVFCRINEVLTSALDQY